MYQIGTQQLGGAADLEDDELVHAFETLTLAEGRFRHADHVRLAWIHLTRTSLADALARLSAGLRRVAAAHGAPDRYHETVTWAFVFLIHERMRRDGSEATWAEFAARHPELLRFEGGALFDHYEPSVLDSDEARRTFLLPRRDGSL